MLDYHTLDNFDFRGKVVGVRVDINSPQSNGKIVMNERIKAAALTIQELVDKGAKIVVLAHQGRPGRSDCVSLKEHKVFLEKQLGRRIAFHPEIYSKDVKEKITLLKNGGVLLLENVRFSKDEDKPEKKDNEILKLEKLFQYYVFDAFSVSHRKQTSIIGFTQIPMVAGRTMEKELKGLNSIVKTPSPHAYMFGGAKPDDLIDLLEIALPKKKVEMVFLTGVIGELALHIKGYYLGKKLQFMEEKGFLATKDRLAKLLKKYSHSFFLPRDVAVVKNGIRMEIPIENLEKRKQTLDENMIIDIGKKTAKYYSIALKKARAIYFKGPAGSFEEKGASSGSEMIIHEIANSKAFTFMGGGHSVTAVDKFRLLNKFSYVSLAGGAIVKFLSGKELAGVVALEKSFKKFDMYEDFVVVGSNVLDLEVSVNKKFHEINIGDKVRLKEDFKSSIGGGGVNVSVCLSRLGAKVGYLGKLCHENYDIMKETLDRNRVKLIKSKLSRKPAAKSVIIDTADRDRVILTYRGQNSDLGIDDFDIKSFRSNSYYLTSLQGKSFQTEIDMIKAIKKRNRNAIFCYNTSSSLVNSEPKLMSLIKLCDILVLNFEEAQALVNESSISNCLREIHMLVDLVIITDGANGAFAYDGKKEYFQKAKKPKEVVDTTGAGDSFAGTFFFFYRKGFGIQKSMEYAITNAASVVEHKGAQPGLMFYKDLVKR